MRSTVRQLLIFLAACMVLAAPVQAMDEAALRGAWDAAMKAARLGPADVPFADQAILNLPGGMAFIPIAESTTLMKLWGNGVGSEFRGLVVSVSNDESWVISIDQIADGFVKDEEAMNWNPDDLLQSLKTGTEEQNKERIDMGIPALDIVGWIEPPRYDSSTHRLVWSLMAVERGAPADSEATVNYNTYALGRDGYFQINLLTGSNTVEKEKLLARQLLTSFHYNAGKRYEDFNAETDHIAEYGIAALIGGVAAKKLGLLAAIGVFFAKFAKLILIGLAVASGAIYKIFRRERPSSE